MAAEEPAFGIAPQAPAPRGNPHAFVKNSINNQIGRALGTIAGGEVISSDAY